MKRQRRKRADAGALPWILLVCAVLAIAFFLLRKPQPPLHETELVIATPIPATPSPATPEPVIVRATPTPAPLVVATPTPPPATPPPALDIATVARTPALWPPAIALVQPTAFPVKMNGRVVGEVKAPAGLTLRAFRVHGAHVEVEYQNARHFIPIASTDLMQRALAIYRQKGSLHATAVAPVATPVSAAAAATPPPGGLALDSARVAERLGIEVVRMKRSRVEGGDYDDKRERIELRVKLSNADTRLSADKFSGEIFIFAQSILDRSALKLLGVETFAFSLPPRGNHEFTTPEVVTMFDTTGARFGHKYEGWVLRLRDSGGNVVVTKSSSPTLAKAVEKASDLTKDKSYDRTTFQEKAESR